MRRLLWPTEGSLPGAFYWLDFVCSRYCQAYITLMRRIFEAMSDKRGVTKIETRCDWALIARTECAEAKSGAKTSQLRKLLFYESRHTQRSGFCRDSRQDQGSGPVAACGTYIHGPSVCTITV